MKTLTSLNKTIIKVIFLTFMLSIFSCATAQNPEGTSGSSNSESTNPDGTTNSSRSEGTIESSSRLGTMNSPNRVETMNSTNREGRYRFCK